MSSIRKRFPVAALLTLSVALLTWACGDSGGNTGPTHTTPDPEPVASVTVAPDSVGIDVEDTQQFSATLRDASGNVLTGRTITWTTSSQTVAPISSSGLVTGGEPGQATITATSEGRSGTATVTVTQALAQDVVAAGTIGPDGGSIGTGDVGLSIDPGELSASTQIEIATYDEPIEEFGSDLATSQYVLRGFPEGQEVQVRVRIRATAPLHEESLIGLGVPIIEDSNDDQLFEPGLLLSEAVDSAGYLVATVTVRGGGAQSTPAGLASGAAAAADTLRRGVVGGVTGAKTDTIAGGRWVIRSWGKPRAELDPMVTRAAKLLNDAWTTLEGMGYSMDHRTQWPMEVQIYPQRAGRYGAFCRKLPFPLDVNLGYFRFNTWAFDQPDMAGTAIHEFYHFVQARYTEGMTQEKEAIYKWVKEAGSTWIEELAPDTLNEFQTGFFRGQRNDLFLGLYPTLRAKDGYGKAPLMKYTASRWGNGQVKKIFESVKAEEKGVDAVLGNIDETPATWWPDLLTKYMKGEIYPLTPDSLPPNRDEVILTAGYFPFQTGYSLKTMGADLFRFDPTSIDLGTGTTLTLRLPKPAHDAGVRILPFRKDAAGKWEEQGGLADSLVIQGSDLKLGREYGVYVIETTPVSPYNESMGAILEFDLGYTDGDWYAENAEVLNDAITYTRTSQNDTTWIDVADNIESFMGLLASGGVWKRTSDDKNRYVWEPTEDFAETLAEFNITASSEARIPSADTIILGSLLDSRVDSLLLKAEFDIDPPTEPVGESGNPAAFGGVGLLLLVGLVMRRKKPILVATMAAASGLFFWGCGITFINFSLKYRYEFGFEFPTLKGSAEDANVPLVELTQGTGTFFVDRYRTEYWEEITNDEGEVVDSVAVITTATGQATVRLDAKLYQDGHPEDEEVAAWIRASGLRGVPPAELREALRAKIRW